MKLLTFSVSVFLVFQRAFHGASNTIDKFLWKRDQRPLPLQVYVSVILNGFDKTFFHGFLRNLNQLVAVRSTVTKIDPQISEPARGCYSWCRPREPRPPAMHGVLYFRCDLDRLSVTCTMKALCRVIRTDTYTNGLKNTKDRQSETISEISMILKRRTSRKVLKSVSTNLIALLITLNKQYDSIRAKLYV